jgi:hypothetical protein
MTTAYYLAIAYLTIGTLFTWWVLEYSDDEDDEPWVINQAFVVAFVVFTVLWPYFVCVSLIATLRDDDL